MRRNDLIALAARVEAATGPDRNLDAAITIALGIGARGLLSDDHEYLVHVRPEDQCAPGTYWFKCRSGASLRMAEAYSASLDAAMTLVPERYGWRLWMPASSQSDDWPRVTVWGPARSYAPNDTEGSTAALALTAAALRATLEQDSGSEGEG